jgi:hypothetical protein
MLSPQPGFSKHLDVHQQLGDLDPLLHLGLRVPLGVMLRLLPSRLWQSWVVVRDVEPLRLPVLVGVDELVHEVLLGGVLPHLDPRSTDYSRVAGARLRLHPEELPEQDPVGLDPQECFTKVDEDCGMENTVGVEVEVLDAVVPQKALEEVTSR